MKKLLFIIIVISQAFSQSSYELPFASKKNILELEVVSESKKDLTGLKLEVVNKPEWLKFSTSLYQPEENQYVAKFEFDVSKNAPVKEQEKIEVLVSNKSGKSWSKEIFVEVKKPAKFELNQNYPNPFNPSTNITYVLAEEAKVSVLIYDILGRKVTELVKEQQEAGYHKLTWNASNYSSGVYFCVLSAKSPLKARFISRKKMLLVK